MNVCRISMIFGLKPAWYRFLYYILLGGVLGFGPFQAGYAQNRPSSLRADSLKQLLETSVSDSVKSEAYIELSRIAQRLNPDSEEHIELAAKSLELALDYQDDLLISVSLNNLGLLKRYQEKYAEAAALHIKAYEQIQDLNVPVMNKIMAANNTGVASRYNGDYDVAVDYYLIALKLAEQIDNKLSMEIAYNGLGITFLKIPGKQEQALEYLEKALAIAIEAGNQRGQAMQYLSISGYYLQQGDYGYARKTLDELMALNQRMNDRHGIAMTHQQISEIYLAEGMLDQAIAQADQALVLFRELDDKIQIGQLLVHLGSLYGEKGDMQRSINYYSESMEMAKELNNRNLIMDNAFLLAEAYEQLNSPAQALHYLKIGQSNKDSINFYQQSVQIESLKRQYDLENKEREIDLLSQKQIAQESQIQTKNLFLFVLSLLLLGVGVITFLQFRIRKARREAILAIQQEEKAKLQAIYERNVIEAEMIASRMQINPHFLFNSLNAIKYLIQVQENDKAVSYLLLLSRFLRRVLETAHKPIHSLRDELELIDYYLKLESNRFENDFKFNINDKLTRWEEQPILPALLLQPFVENAIWHGLLPEECIDKRMDINVWNDDTQIFIQIEDFGIGRLAAGLNAKRMHPSRGHEITNKRIELYNKQFPEQIGWQILDKVDENGVATGTKVCLSISMDQ